MKKYFIIILIASSITACEFLHIGSQTDTIVSFSFVDLDGNDIFADSLSIEDFKLSSIEGYASLVLIDSILDSNYHFEINFGPGNDGDEESVTLFQLKDDIDTVEVTFKNNYHRIRDVFYNGELVNFQSELHNSCTIIK